jgi:hypothetical protein
MSDMSQALADDDATLVTERVLEGVVALGKAEIRLAVSELRVRFEKALFAGALLWLAACVTQVAIALICVSPLLFGVWSPAIVLSSIFVSTVVGVLFGFLGMSRMRAAFRTAPKSVRADTAVTAQTLHPKGSAHAE